MTLLQLLSILRDRNIHISAEGDKLLYSSLPGLLTPELRDNLKQHKSQILHLLQQNRNKESSYIPISSISNNQKNSLSFAQERLWFFSRMDPESASYNVPSAMRLTGKLNKDALQRSLDEIVLRHEVLRTTFVEAAGRPVQAINPAQGVDIRQLDLTDKPEPEREEVIKGLLSEEAGKPFDLAIGPLLRAVLYRLAEEEHIFLVTIHHIAYDGWSRGVFFRELSVLYEAYSKGEKSPLSEPAIQYADYAVWQRQWLQGEVLNKQMEYWKQKLEGAPRVLELPMDRPRPAVQTQQGAKETFILPRDLAEGLKALSQRENVTLFMLLLAAFKVLLFRYSGQDDILIGVPIANRTRVELEDLIGFFVNTLVLRTDLSGEPTFQELLGRVRETTLESYGHQDLPFEKLVEELKPERHLSYSPIFQVMFALQNTPDFSLVLPELTIQTVEVDTLTAKVDLILTIKDSKEGLKASVNYNTALFDARTIKTMFEHYEVLLKETVRNTAQNISRVNMLTEAEKHQLLFEWNQTTSEYPREKCIQTLFEEQTKRTPDAVAIVCDGEQLTYKGLNVRSNRLAHYLRAKGMGQEALVGICIERSIEMIVGILGILKAGGAYLPLDPSYPEERLAIMIEHARIPLLLTQKSLLERFPETIHAVCLDSDHNEISQSRDENPFCEDRPENLAYVMYTSGSTGKPKGVCIQHRSIVRLVKGVDYAELTEKEVFLQLASLSFDASTFEIWGCLLNGGRLVIMPHHIFSLKELGQAINDYRITTLWLTAGLFHLMVAERNRDLGHLRQLLAGGDVLSVSHVKKFLHQNPHCRLINGYGPTENTTFTCCYPLTKAEQTGTSSVPIGRPISNTRVYILDAYMQLLPTGVPGELYIGGDGLALGYLGQPDLTAEKFVPDIFSKEPAARLYKTGDRARYLPDGNIEFLGRLDLQVKVRGFRIEPGEIETILSQHSSVKESVVIAQELSGDKRLVAYCVLKRDMEATVSDLRSYLKKKLPDYMLPSVFVFLENLPLSSNGKIDRKRLFVPERIQTGESSDDEPLDELEVQIGKIWETILGVRHVGKRDNFFDLGGHSLLAVRLLAEIKKATGKELPIATIFHSPTIMQIGEVLRSGRLNLPWKLFMPVQPYGPRKPFFWIYGGSSNSQLPKYLGLDQPLYCMISQRCDEKPVSHDDIVAQSIKEIIAIEPDGPYFMGGFCFGGLLALELARQLLKAGKEVSLMVLVETSPVCLPMIRPYRERKRHFGISNRKDSSHRTFREKIAPLRILKRRIKKRVVYGIRQAVSKVLLAAGFSLPYAFRKVYIEKMNRRAMLHYVPYIFPGKAVVFKAAGRQDDGCADWSSLAYGGVEMHNITGAGHRTMRKEPYMGIWAKRLSLFLEDEQRDISDNKK